MEWFNQIEFWHWLILATMMIIIEMLLPAAYFLWMAISAFTVGLLLYFIPTMPILIQIIVFGLLSILAIALYKHYKKQHVVAKEEPHLNRRGQQYVGRVFTLHEPIVNGIGKVQVDDSIWKVAGVDMAAGQTVIVVSIDNTVLNVQLADTSSIKETFVKPTDVAPKPS